MLSPVDIQRLTSESADAQKQLKELIEKSDETASLLKVAPPKTYAGIDKLQHMLVILSEMPVNADAYIALLFRTKKFFAFKRSISLRCAVEK